MGRLLDEEFGGQVILTKTVGEILRDSHGIAQVKVVTGNKILRILKSSGTILS